jgi:hypothetical protein
MEGVTEGMAMAHAIWRFVILITGVVAIGKCLLGQMNKREWTPADQSIGVYFVTVVNLGALLGAAVWLLQGRWDMADALRSWRHPSLMLIGVLSINWGWFQARVAPDAASRFSRCTTFFISGSAIILFGVLQIRGVF